VSQIPKSQFDFVLKLVCISCATFVWFIFLIYCDNSNLISGIGVLVGVGIPLVVGSASKTKKEQQSREALVRWCDTVTNSNLTTIDQDLFPQLKNIQESIVGYGFDSYNKIELFHQSFENNLDVSAYESLLNSGLYYGLDEKFQRNLMYTREVIKKASVLFSNQEFTMQNTRDIALPESGERKIKVTKDLVATLEDRLTEVRKEIVKLKTNITIYKNNSGIL
jgi:hypothetical protein